MRRFFSLFLTCVIVIIFVPAIIIFVFDFGNDVPDSFGEKNKIAVLSNGKISEFELEEYLFGVLAAEMPAQFHIEALKAQAVAARTYIVNKSKNGDRQHPDADVCTDSTHCKAYLSNEEITEKFGGEWHSQYSSKISDAIKETQNEVAVYEGEPIEAVFHSTSGGMTENARDVWGNDVPYLVSVKSPGDELSPKFLNDISVSLDVFKEKASQQGDVDVSLSVGEITRNESGSVKTINLGGLMLDGVTVREMFSLPSANFTVTAENDEFTFHCKGKGHGVGMSQYGAEYFANQGMNYKEILKKYYTGIEVVNIEETNDKNS